MLALALMDFFGCAGGIEIGDDTNFLVITYLFIRKITIMQILISLYDCKE